jgi:phenylacetic acid degradation operon negative regulatory protein
MNNLRQKQSLGLRHNLLTYIGYSLEGKFRYNKLSSDFIQIGINHEASTLRKEFSLLKKEGLITFKLRYRKPYPILTTKGKLEIKTRLASKKFDHWDGKWRVVLFDLPQDDRKYRLLLVEELLALGFAPLHRAAYISPYPVTKIVERMTNHWGIRQNLSFLTVAELENEKNLAKCWNLDEINNKYKDYIKMTQRFQRHARLWPIQAKWLEQSFADIYSTDPHLPKELLPKDWAGLDAYNTFKDIANSY